MATIYTFGSYNLLDTDLSPAQLALYEKGKLSNADLYTLLIARDNQPTNLRRRPAAPPRTIANAKQQRRPPVPGPSASTTPLAASSFSYTGPIEERSFEFGAEPAVQNLVPSGRAAPSRVAPSRASRQGRVRRTGHAWSDDLDKVRRAEHELAAGAQADEQASEESSLDLSPEELNLSPYDFSPEEHLELSEEEFNKEIEYFESGKNVVERHQATTGQSPPPGELIDSPPQPTYTPALPLPAYTPLGSGSRLSQPGSQSSILPQVTSGGGTFGPRMRGTTLVPFKSLANLFT